jgi:serine/threonine-protein kinase HipA
MATMSNPIKRPSVLEVWLNDARVGTITNLPYDRNLFVLDEAYVADQDRPTLSLSFLDSQRNVITRPQDVTARVPPFFSNLLPEGHLREYLAERGHINAIREFFLLWLLGADLPGAVRVQDAEGRALPPRDDNERRRMTMPDEDVLRFSLAGVQLKFSAIGQPGKQLAIPVEGRGGHSVVKLPSARYPHVPENEFSMMKLASEIGIDVAEVTLAPTNSIQNLPAELVNDESNSLIVKRFDRTSEDRRIHIEDFNQVYEQYPAAKYKNFSYGNMAGDIWRVLGEAALAEFVRRLVFNAGIGNADMHLKNWSLIYPDGRTPRLAPGYDFVSTIQYIENRKMALSMAGEKDTTKLDRDLISRFAARARIPTHSIDEIAVETAEKLVAAWRRMKHDLPLDDVARKKIDQQLEFVPLTRQFVQNGLTAKIARNRPHGRRGRPRKSTVTHEDIP